MSINWAAAGIGVLDGVNKFKQEQKELEQQNYDRGRQAESDRQTKVLHEQTVKQNEFTLDTKAKEIAEANRKEALNKKIGQYQQLKLLNDVDSAAKLYVENANQDNLGNPNWNPNHALAYAKKEDGTLAINVVDKNTGAFIQEARSGVGIDDFISATYQQMDPTQSYENEVANAAKVAEEKRKNDFELEKEKTKHGYDVELEGIKSKNQIKLEGVKNQNQVTLEGMRQEGQDRRVVYSQAGQNYRATLPKSGNGKVASEGTDGILGLYQNNPEIFAGLEGEDLDNALALGAIESGGNTGALSSAGAGGLMQIMPGTSQYIAQKYGFNTNTPQGNVAGGSAYFNEQLRNFNGDVDLALMAYNWGPGHAKNYQKYGSGMKLVNGKYVPGYHPDVRVPQETLDHIERFKYAKGLIQSNRGVQTGNAAAGGATNNVAIAAKRITELFSGDFKPNEAAVLGDLSNANGSITQFARAKTRDERKRHYNNISRYVDLALQNTPAYQAGQITTAQLKGLRAQIIPQLVGAKSLAEVGSFINQPDRQAKAKANSKTGSMSGRQLNDVISEVSIEPPPQPKAAANTKAPAGAGVRLPNPMGTPKIQQTTSSFRPPSSTPAKPAARPAAKPAEKKLSLREQQKAAQRDAVNKRIWAEKKAEAEAKQKKEAEQKAARGRPVQFNLTATEAAENLKRKLGQNKS